MERRETGKPKVAMPSTNTAERRIADRYVLRSPLGKGGMGVVWHAEDTLLRRSVAIKEIAFPSALEASEAMAVKMRAMREARSAAKLNHPGVVSIYDVIQEEGQAYIVMEFVEAPTLAGLVKREGPLLEQRTAEIGLEVLEALQNAHAKGVVHRDVKPANVMILDGGRAKLADFGIASVKDDPKITSTGMILGSPQFMAPEQANGAGSGPPTDVWGLGATLYYAVEGEYPFDRGEPIPTLAAVVHDDYRPPQRAGALEPIIAETLKKSPRDRPPAWKLRTMLRSAMTGEQPAAMRQPVPAVAAPTTEVSPPPSTLDAPPAERPARTQSVVEPEVIPLPRTSRARPRQRHRWLVPLLAAGLLAAGLLVFFLLTSGDERQPPPAARDETNDGRRAPAVAGSAGNEEKATTTPSPTPTSDEAAGPVDDVPSQDFEETAVQIPSDWVRWRDPTFGFSIRHPPDWTVQPGPHDSTSIDIEDPNGGTYLRVDWTDTPGPSPQAAWEAYAPDFAATHSDYQEIQITPTTFKGYLASVWEFTYSSGGAQLHAIDLGFIIGDEYGFALNFQTREEDWAQSKELFDAFQKSFRPPPG
ncbi:MAG: protein kinase [Actinomycetota bacterium]|nr:protein kinase [Actinomycetota bacterium]